MTDMPPAPDRNDELTPEGFPKHHIGDELVRIMMINLETNNRNPEAIEAQKEAREMAWIKRTNEKLDEAPRADQVK